jgi:hypothetical protein
MWNRANLLKKNDWRSKQKLTDPEKAYNYRRAEYFNRKYGITIADYNLMVKNQGGLCPVCGDTLPPELDATGRHSPVDHDHLTGKVRGVVHNDCNRALGFFKDSPKICRKAAEYLEKESVNARNGKTTEV